MKIRKIVSLLLCCITIAAMFSLSACGDKGTYVDAFNSYMQAQDDLNSQQIVNLLPPQFYNYRVHRFMDGRMQLSEEKAKEQMLILYRALLESADFLMVYPDTDLKTGYSYKYKIIDEYKASAKEVAEFNAYAKEKLGFNEYAQELVLIKYEFSIRKNGETIDVFDGVEGAGVCFKYDEKWYYAEASMNEIMWVDRQGLRINDGVEWMYEWL